ncbi:MAG TPA: inorganic phosphate transporter [Thermoanaerobaculia bacterium]|nr:inorganic phosphate transporter [Thermoanaerobaculia bacterium]
MTFAVASLAALAAAVAWANGSNDVSKGIATLIGSGVSNERAAVMWGSAWTGAGALAAAFAAQGLVATFSGRGFLAEPVVGPSFLAAVAIGAAAWVFFASKTGLPVSTTHAITGALAGAAVVAQGAGILHWSYLARWVVLPLALSPVAAIALLHAIFPLLRRGLARVDAYCVCVERRSAILPGGAAALRVVVAEGAVLAAEEECAASPTVAGRLNVLDGLHWLSSAAASFARGVNDAPKIVALGVLSSVGLGISGVPFYAAIAVAMTAGSLVGGFRVTETLARRVTRMTPGEGFSANLVTSLLVSAASLAALPVSTTHVSSSAIIGIGLHRGARAVAWPTVREMVLAWLVTLPAAALVAAAAAALLRA